MQTLRVVVIGGGAAGFFGAIACAETYPHTQVTLLEASHQLLSKVRISGGGRCNVTHACFEPAGLVQNYPRGGKALRGAFTRFQPQDTIAWFAKHGVQLKTESDGRMFPTSDDSETIVNCLIKSAESSGVKIRTGTPVISISKQAQECNEITNNPKSKIQNLKLSGFEIKLKSGEIILCDRIMFATGSNPICYQLAKDLGHTIEPPVPSLFTFNIKDARLEDLAGVSVESARLRLLVGDQPILEQTGPLLITHWGLSGPAVLKLSAWGARILHESKYQATLIVNWLPQYNSESLRQKLGEVKSEWSKKAIATIPPVPLPKRLWQRLISTVGINEEERWAELSKKTINILTQELCEGKYQIKGKGVFKEEFVTCGGISLKEIDFKTMQSRICPGVYFAGEILDIDGITGGFNFQSAWTTAWIAGNAIAQNAAPEANATK